MNTGIQRGFNCALACAAIVFLTSCAALQEKAPANPVTAGNVIEMSRAGVPPREIIQDIKSRGVDELPPSQVARLRENGVSEAVIDAMRETYMSEKMRNRQPGDWHGANFDLNWPYKSYGQWPYPY